MEEMWLRWPIRSKFVKYYCYITGSNYKRKAKASSVQDIRGFYHLNVIWMNFWVSFQMAHCQNYAILFDGDLPFVYFLLDYRMHLLILFHSFLVRIEIPWNWNFFDSGCLGCCDR